MNSRFFSIPLAAALVAGAATSLTAQVSDTTPRVPTYAGRLHRRDSLVVQSGERAPSPDQALEQRVFPPDLVLQCRERIGLKTEQRDAIRAAMRDMQSKTMDMQWKLQDEAEKLNDALKRPSVNEAETLAQVDRVLGAEREVKRAQMTMLIRIKNVLTPEQQDNLRNVRERKKSFPPARLEGCDEGGGGA
jgi:heavy-metal resistance protein